MSFERFVCWEPSRILHVMNTEALQPRNEVFLATHHPVRMYRGSRADDARVPYDQESFRRDFLAPEGFAFVPVLGNAGTGKSHLVRWLWLNLPRDEAKRKVILIPRGGTNLRGVVELILGDMEGPAFDRYRDRLRAATNSLSLPQARHVLLDHLALATGPDGARGQVPDVSADEREAHEHLQTYLPALLRDQFFRSHLLQEGGIIDELVRHVLGSADAVERRESRRQFSKGDLPLSVTDYQRAGADARQIFGELSTDPWLLDVAVGWLNLHLEEAIGRLLQLGAADLTLLMRDVRAALAEQGVELVLLIEDFARLQGIERQLLDALLEQPNQPDRRLCALRTALACTNKYFQKVEDTVSQRTTFVVSLNRDMTGEGAVVSPQEFQHFAARYLNAARVGGEALQRWYDGRDGREDAPAPNACAACDFAPTCHAAFGAEGGMGLYPFNRVALGEMYARVGAQGFSPRQLITGVLRPTLEKYGPDLEEGTFPPPALLAGLGGSRISAADRAEIVARGTALAPRREVLQEFWAGGRLVDLDPAVHRAFELPAAGFGTEILPPSPPVGFEPPVGHVGHVGPGQPQGMPRRAEETFLALDRWQNGTRLTQDATTVLRGLVFDGVANRIDWSAEMLLRGEFASATGSTPFRQRSINFQNQDTQFSKALVQLTLPLAGDSLTDTALALQALLLYDHYGDWRFTRGLGGARYQRVLARMVERWAGEVLGQVRATFRPEPWDPVPAAVELLALGARMAGGLSPLRPSAEELVDAVFAPLPDGTDGRAPAWAELVQALRKHREALSDVVIARVGASKGTERARIVDAARLVRPLAAVSAEWKPGETVPDDLPAPHFDALRRARSAADRLLDEALDQERQRQLAAFAGVAAHLGGVEHKVAAEAVRTAMARARDGGVFSGVNAEVMERAVLAFRSSAFVAWADHVGRVQAETEPRQLIGLLSQDHSRAAAAAGAFVEAVDRFLATSTQRAEAEVAQLTEGAGRDLDATLRGIDDSFTALDAALAQIAEETP